MTPATYQMKGGEQTKRSRASKYNIRSSSEVPRTGGTYGKCDALWICLLIWLDNMISDLISDQMSDQMSGLISDLILDLIDYIHDI
jgi:hypothetical protein